MTSERTTHVRLTASEADPATSMRSGDMSVLATPRVVELCEEAACAAVVGALESGRTSIGTWIELEHLAAIPIGAEVVAAARFIRADGRGLEFDVAVTDSGVVVRLVEQAGMPAARRHRSYLPS